jgi:hypothetical protein
VIVFLKLIPINPFVRLNIMLNFVSVTENGLVFVHFFFSQTKQSTKIIPSIHKKIPRYIIYIYQELGETGEPEGDWHA